MLLVLILASLCYVSASGLCNDKDTSCFDWAKDGECEGVNGAHVKDLCPHSCGVCSIVCGDLDDNCAAWAKEGECETSPAYMKKNCPTSASARPSAPTSTPTAT